MKRAIRKWCPACSPSRFVACIAPAAVIHAWLLQEKVDAVLNGSFANDSDLVYGMKVRCAAAKHGECTHAPLYEHRSRSRTSSTRGRTSPRS